MKYTLIGGAGFIGQNVAKHLKESGHEVTVIDDLSSFGGKDFKRQRRESLVCDRFIEKSCGEVEHDDFAYTDVLVHLASKTDYHPYYGEYIRNNCAELASLMEQPMNDVGRFILISSQTVYGKAPLPYSVTETHLQPTEHYGLSKLVQEQIVRVLSREVPYAIIRPVIVLGPGQNGQSLYAGLIKNTVARLKAGMRPMIYGDGEQLRCFVSVHDIARLLARAEEIPGLVNATSREGAKSVNWVVARIQEIMGTHEEPLVNEYVRKVDLMQKDCVSAYNFPDDAPIFGAAAAGEVLEEHVKDLLKHELPYRGQIEALDRHNEEEGVIVKV
jgi:UDP-glucose 4-epimerase